MIHLLRIIAGIVGVFTIFQLVFGDIQAETVKSNSNILYVELPDLYLETASMDLVMQLTDQKISEWIDMSGLPIEELSKIDLIIIHTREGKPILPDRSRVLAESELLDQSTNEITFTFNSLYYPWTEEEIETLQTWIDDFYPVIKMIYGNPAFNISVNVRKNPNISFAGLYYVYSNEMVLRYLGDHVFVHELIHAFRDDNIISMSNYEEGMTRACEVETFNHFDNYDHWDKHHQYGHDVYYDLNNQPHVAAKGGNFFRGFINALLRYQLSGYAWAKLLLEHPEFFIEFNRNYYSQILINPEVKYTESLLKDIVRNIKPDVEREDFDKWYAKQHVLNTNPEIGCDLLLMAQNAYSFTIYYFCRSESGHESMQTNEMLYWKIYDYNENLIDIGSGITNSNGWVGHYHLIPDGYTGRIRIVANAYTQEGEVERTFLRNWGTSSWGTYSGVFGVIEGQNEGQLIITPLDDPHPPISVDVLNGSFIVPQLERIRGKFSAVFTNSYNPLGERIFTKDASNYFLNIVVTDNIPPGAICQDVTVSTEPGLCIADASVDNCSFDPDGDEITFDQAPPGPYDLGDTDVTLTVTDDKGASDTCDATVTVVDEEDPVISSVTANPNKLWPPNHKMAPVSVAVDATDNCDSVCKIVLVESNEPVNGLGDGNTSPDWIITGDLTVELRAERSGKGNGRVYTITVECEDKSENSATDNATVTVPHDKGKKNNQNKKKKK